MLKKISKFIKKNLKIVIAFSIGVVLTSTSVYAANTIYSKNVTYDNSSSGLTSANVQDAIDELYLKIYPSQFYKSLYESAVMDNKSSTYVSGSSGIDFSKTSSDTNGKGLYIASEYSDYKYPILYYRGDVTNNNLIFANFCWKIVRTTETGGIKLIYNGTPTNGTCNNTGISSQIGTSAFNTNHDSPSYVGYMYGTPYIFQYKSMSGVTNNYYYGNDVTYSNGKYTLVNTISSSNWSSIWNGGINNNHYTCMGGTTCSTVYYIYYTESNAMYYIALTNGKKIEDALSDMLDNNTTSSTIKGSSSSSGTIDNWYYTNIEKKGYSSYVEDTVWCVDRSISRLNGWDPDGGSTRNFLYFSAHDRANTSVPYPNLVCRRKIDRFTVSDTNGNGDLDYPVGLLTVDEIMLAGGRYGASGGENYLSTGISMWVISPFSISNSYALVLQGAVDVVNSVRPSISLAPDVEISGGNGTSNNPYVVE